jgi:hypothetical protein
MNVEVHSGNEEQVNPLYIKAGHDRGISLIKEMRTTFLE